MYKNVDSLKVNSAETYCINELNDSQKLKVLYTWEIKDVIIDFPSVQNFLFQRIISSKIQCCQLIQQISTYLCTLYTLYKLIKKFKILLNC